MILRESKIDAIKAAIKGDHFTIDSIKGSQAEITVVRQLIKTYIPFVYTGQEGTYETDLVQHIPGYRCHFFHDSLFLRCSQYKNRLIARFGKGS